MSTVTRHARPFAAYVMKLGCPYMQGQGKRWEPCQAVRRFEQIVQLAAPQLGQTATYLQYNWFFVVVIVAVTPDGVVVKLPGKSHFPM
jgi:hypothetical protein